MTQLDRVSEFASDCEIQFIPAPLPSPGSPFTAARQRAFIAALAEHGCVKHAAAAVGLPVSSVYLLRRSKGAESFAAAWQAALADVRARMMDTLVERALNGWVVRGSTTVRVDGSRTEKPDQPRYNDSATLALLKSGQDLTGFAEDRAIYAPAPDTPEARREHARLVRQLIVNGELERWLDGLEAPADPD